MFSPLLTLPAAAADVPLPACGAEKPRSNGTATWAISSVNAMDAWLPPVDPARARSAAMYRPSGYVTPSTIIDTSTRWRTGSKRAVSSTPRANDMVRLTVRVVSWPIDGLEPFNGVRSSGSRTPSMSINENRKDELRWPMAE